MDDDDLAYDGSNEQQLRDLTARERDILCRLISQELRKPAGLHVQTPFGGLVLQDDPAERPVLLEMRNILDPRRGH